MNHAEHELLVLDIQLTNAKRAVEKTEKLLDENRQEYSRLLFRRDILRSSVPPLTLVK
jgi:hypothetical protein